MLDQFMRRFMPSWVWLRQYQRVDLKGDLNAGLTVAVMLVPQGMAYAMLAGLPPIAGLYAAVVPLIVYALFGTSRQLAVGPVAMVSLLVASSLSHLAEPGSEHYLALAALLAAMVGVFKLAMGVARLGFLVNFLAHPVVSGFTAAAALIIAASQLQHLMGVKLPGGHHVHVVIWHAFAALDRLHWPTVIIGLASMALLLFLKRWKPLFPGALLTVVLGTLAVQAFDLEAAGVATVGNIPRGLAPPAFPVFTWEEAASLVPVAAAIALVGFMESIAVAQAFASKNRYRLDANQELLGLGLANVAAGLFGAFPVTGGFSRTAVNAQAGARTGLASLITAAMVALTLWYFTPLFHHLPIAVLAAIIVVAVLGLVEVAEARRLYQVKRSDFLLLSLAFVATLVLGIETGILTGVVASLVLVIKRTTNPHWARLGRLPGTQIYRNIDRYPEATVHAGVPVLRIDAPLYFANAAFLRERILQLAAEAGSAPCRAIVFDAGSVNDLDSSALAALQEITRELKRGGIALYLANVRGPVRDVMQRAGFYESLGANHFFYSVHDAVQRATGEIAALNCEGPRGVIGGASPAGKHMSATESRDAT